MCTENVELLAQNPITANADNILLPYLNRIASTLEKLVGAIESLAESQQRQADAVAPARRIVGTRYVADKTGHTTQWVREQIESGRIPKHCIAQHTSNGGYWKFHADRIDQWVEQL